jgi:hypothetical protein
VDLVPVSSDFGRDHATLVAMSRQRRLSSLSLAVPEWNVEPKREPCALDRMRPGTQPGHIPEKPAEKVSGSVNVRRKYGREQKSAFYKKIADRHPPKTAAKRCLNFCTEFSEIAGSPPPGCGHLSGKIAVIYLDGNSFGKRIRACAGTAEAYREVSASIAKDRETMLTGLLERMESDPPGWKNGDMGRLETLIWGGDEILWVVPAWKGWETLRYFYEQARAWKIPGDKDTTPLTHSAGLVFAHVKAPIQRLESLARQLAEKAKTASKRAADAFACEALESFDHTGVSLESYYARRYPHWRQQRPDTAQTGWLGFEHLTLHGPQMAAIQDEMRRLEMSGQFPHRRLHMNVRKVLDSASAAAAAEAVKDEAGNLGKLPEFFTSPSDAATWLHAAMLWDYVARVPGPVTSSNSAPAAV